MNMFKKNGGFTLVELIVVIAILAILAGVAVPAYSGYITKAQDAAVVSELSAVLTAAQASAVSAADANGGEVDAISVPASGSISVTVGDDTITDLSPFYTAADLTALQSKMAATTTYESGANWKPGAGWTPGT